VRYEINGDHPLFERLSELLDDNAKKLLEDYVHSIANSFPINRMHSDIFNEKKIAKDSEAVEYENVKGQFLILLRFLQGKERDELIERLAKTEPFCNYIDKLIEFSEEFCNV